MGLKTQRPPWSRGLKQEPSELQPIAWHQNHSQMGTFGFSSLTLRLVNTARINQALCDV